MKDIRILFFSATIGALNPGKYRFTRLRPLVSKVSQPTTLVETEMSLLRWITVKVCKDIDGL